MEHDGHRLRLRERFSQEDLRTFQYHEALELLLTFAIPRRDTNALAHALIDRFGTFHDVLEAPIDELCQVPGIGENAATLLHLMVPLQRMYEQSKLTRKICIRNAGQLRTYCVSLFRGMKTERFYVLSFDAQLQLLGTDMISEGTPNQVSVYPRMVLSSLLRRGATGAVLTHNHPGGSKLPSQQDVDLTAEIAALLRGVDIRLFDHVLVAADEGISFHQLHLLPENASEAEEAEEAPIAATYPQRVLPLRKPKG